jgi:hypothetical protein
MRSSSGFFAPAVIAGTGVTPHHPITTNQLSANQLLCVYTGLHYTLSAYPCLPVFTLPQSIPPQLPMPVVYFTSAHSELK